jgi:hypothetical protein
MVFIVAWRAAVSRLRLARREIAEIEAGWSRNSEVAGLPPELRDGLEAAIERAESHREVV